MWTAIINALFQVLKLFYSFTRDWGLAIILMTLVFRILVWPLMTKQVKSTVGMQKIQPLMKEVQEKYADDKQRQSEEMMKLYKEQKVSPFAGCLPLLLQMPLLFAFYSMLNIARADKSGILTGGGPLYKSLAHYSYLPVQIADKVTFVFTKVKIDPAPFLRFIHLPGVKTPGFLPDIMTTPDMILKAHGGWNNILGALPSLWPYLVILLLFAIGSLIPMLMMPGGNSQNKNMGIFMSLFMLFIGFNIPAGALLYYDVSTLFAVGQQAFIQKRMEAAEEEEIAEIIAAEEPSKKKGKKNSGSAKDDPTPKLNEGSSNKKGSKAKNTGADSQKNKNTGANSQKAKNTGASPKKAKNTGADPKSGSQSKSGSKK
ncbi:MAG: YidC/Oxa1 family membrane protein insertase [Coriobacteriia bacterium]|nr:YidC/Oxa1 family membrane protein insertase [Coriobacteriia bacterium]